MAALTMVMTAAAIILLVRFGLLRGIGHMASSLQWSAKTRGQATGFATSVPELVCLIATGLSGVWEAGLWNIAASNIINIVLMTAAVLWFRQARELKNRSFIDEIGFAGAAVVLPIVLMAFGVDRNWVLVPLLLGFFLAYRLLDRKLNPPEGSPEEEEAAGSLPVGIILSVVAVAAIAGVGIILGSAAESVVNDLGIHPAAAGWILGAVTSLPELVTFFAVYSAAQRAELLDSPAATQEALDNLAASNVANVGVVYPLGLAAFLIVTAVLGS